MREWAVICLNGTSTTELIVTVFACSSGSAFWKCRRAGFQPLGLIPGPAIFI